MTGFVHGSGFRVPVRQLDDVSEALVEECGAPVTQLSKAILRHPLRLRETTLPGLRDDNN